MKTLVLLALFAQVRETVCVAREGSYVLGIPACGPAASDARSWTAKFTDRRGRPWPAFARVEAADAEGRVRWWSVQGEAPADGGEVRIGPGEKTLAVDALRVPQRFDLFDRFAGSVTLTAGGETTTLTSGTPSIEDSTPLRTVFAWKGVRATFRSDGEVEVEVLAEAGARRVARVELVVRGRESAQRVGPAAGWRPLPDAAFVLESHGGETLYLRTRTRGGERVEELRAKPDGIAVGFASGALLMHVERFERREPASISADGAEVRVALLSEPRDLRAGQAVAGRVRLRWIGDGAPLAPSLHRLAQGPVAWLEFESYRKRGALGFLETPVVAGDASARAAFARAFPTWVRSSRGSYGFGFRDDGDPPIAVGFPSNLEFDAARAALLGCGRDLGAGLEAARAAALHWRAVDRGGPETGFLPRLHAREHAGDASEEGHVWVQGLLDVSFLTDDPALRRDLLAVGDALRAREADRSLERTLAWPLLAFCALEPIAPGRGYRAAADRLVAAATESEGPLAGVLRVESRFDPEREELTWSPWLGGGLWGEALFEHARLTGRAAELRAVADVLMDLAYDPREQAFARRLVFREGPGPVRVQREGILTGIRNTVILSTLARAASISGDPRAASIIRAVLRSSRARVLREPASRAHRWTLAFRMLGAIALEP